MSKRQDFSISDLSARELISKCGEKLEDAALWEELYHRFKRKIVVYLSRAYRLQGGSAANVPELIQDWVQDIFTKLLQNQGRVLKSFRGDSDLSLNAFFASMATTVVADYLRAQRAKRRFAKLVSIDDVLANGIELTDVRTPYAQIDLIDAEQHLAKATQSKNPARDLLIFKLHFFEGLTAREIAAIETFQLTVSGTEKVIGRLRARLLGADGSRAMLHTE